MTKQQKANHVQRLLQQTATMRQVHAALAELRQEADDLGYGQGGASPIAAADLPPQLAFLGGPGYHEALQTLADLEAVLAAAGPNNGPSLRARLRQLQP
jgi:hypothetical protein